MQEYKEWHLQGDLLLIYRKDEAARVIMLYDIGTHSELFGV